MRCALIVFQLRRYNQSILVQFNDQSASDVSAWCIIASSELHHHRDKSWSHHSYVTIILRELESTQLRHYHPSKLESSQLRHSHPLRAGVVTITSFSAFDIWCHHGHVTRVVIQAQYAVADYVASYLRFTNNVKCK